MNEKDLEKLVFGIAHQIRNPCAIILANTNLLIKTMQTTPQARQSLDAIVNGVKYIQERLDEFLEFSKPLHPKFQEVKLYPLVQGVFGMLRDKCALQKTALANQVDPALALPQGDQQMLFLAMLNIILNAVESIKAGGSVNVSSARDAHEIALVIRDTGCGVHPRDLPEMFSPFYSTKEGGIGIGLPVAKRILDAHRGKIEVQSEQGRGTTVTVRFPLGAQT